MILDIEKEMAKLIAQFEDAGSPMDAKAQMRYRVAMMKMNRFDMMFGESPESVKHPDNPSIIDVVGAHSRKVYFTLEVPVGVPLNQHLDKEFARFIDEEWALRAAANGWKG